MRSERLRFMWQNGELQSMMLNVGFVFQQFHVVQVISLYYVIRKANTTVVMSKHFMLI